MGEVHRLIRDVGPKEAQRLAATFDERKCVDIAAQVMSVADGRQGYTHSGFAMTSLPHLPTTMSMWIKEGGDCRLVLEAGRDRDGNVVPLPYGMRPRQILIYLQTEAIANNTREISLGPSLNAFMSRMGSRSGGSDYKQTIEQARRISACRLTFHNQRGDASIRHNGGFVATEIRFANSSAGQGRLWQDTVILDEAFYAALCKTRVELLEEAVRALSPSSMALDIYVWLAFRLNNLLQQNERLEEVSWQDLHRQFGGGFAELRYFKPKFRRALELALAAYPQANVNFDQTKGVTLYPSDLPTAKSNFYLAGSSVA